MDGPFHVQLDRVKNQCRFTFISNRKAVNEQLVADTEKLKNLARKDVLHAAEVVLLKCRNERWHNGEIDELSKTFARLTGYKNVWC